MSLTDDTRPDPAAQDPRREGRWAVWGAAVSAALILAAAAFRGALDPWLVAVALLAPFLASAILPALGGRRRGLGRVLLRPAGYDPRREAPQGVADTILAQIPDPVILVDQRALVVEANAAAHRLLPGLKPAQPLSFALRSPDVLDGIGQVAQNGLPLRTEYHERVPTERTFEVHLGPLFGPLRPDDPRGGRPGILLFFRDLTSARRLEAMRSDFIANASHELRTPLASVLGFIETLQGPARNDPAARERFLGIMQEQAQRMKRLVDDLLSLSRIEMRAHMAPTAAVDLNAVAAHMIETLSPLIRSRGVALRPSLPGQPVLVPGDRDELLRVVENLIENAVKYGESGGRVDVELASRPAGEGHGPEAVLCVRDYGPGIAPEHLPRLTERFYRVDVAQSRQKGGTGLGLAIVKHIVQRHRGHLAIESEPGQGARFTVTLPLIG